jgi:hypothetical protein
VESGLPLMGGIVGAGGEISWPKPTRPGDILQVVSEVEEAVPSRSRPARGMARVRSETRNQRGETVQILLAKLIVPRRAPTTHSREESLRTTSNSMILVPLLNPKFAIELAARCARTSGSGH